MWIWIGNKLAKFHAKRLNRSENIPKSFKGGVTFLETHGMVNMTYSVVTPCCSFFSMHKRDLCRHTVSLCVCVRVSVTFVSCVKTNKGIFEIFLPSGSHSILVFPYQTGWRYSDGNPPNGGVECKGYDKNTIFSQISRSISETVIVRWAHSARQFVSIEFSFHPYNI